MNHRTYCIVLTGMAFVTAFIFWWTGVSPIMGFALLTFGVLTGMAGLGGRDGLTAAANFAREKVEDATEGK